MDKSLMLTKIREHYNLTRNVDFARRFNVSEQVSNGWMKRGYLDYETIYKYCPEISPDWLLSGGEGPMLREERDAEPPSPAPGCNPPPAPSPSPDTLGKALDALRCEQGISTKAQEQADRLITIIDKITNSKD